MNRKFPVRSLYIIQLCLSANAPKQNMFAIDLPYSSSPIRFGPVLLCITGGGGQRICITCAGMPGSWWVTFTIGCISVLFFVFGVVLLIPCCGLFICSCAVAGLALKYLWINFSLWFGYPSRKPRQTALMSVNIFGLHTDWCANLTPFALVLMDCVKLATFGTPSCASDGNVYLLLCGGG